MLPFLPSKLLQNLGERKWKINPEAYCNCCNKLGGVTFKHKLIADFDISERKDISWISKFEWAEDGICMSCGHFQRYSRLNHKELEEYLKIFSDKSKTNEGIISKSPIHKGEGNRISIIRCMHKTILQNTHIKKIYIARPTSVKIIGELKILFNADLINFNENNEITKAEIMKEYGHKSWLKAEDSCQVHGEIEFPEGHDLYIIIHCLQHSIDLKENLDSLERQIGLGKSVLLLDEVQRKLHNPFHVNHMSEDFLMRELRNRKLNTTLIQGMTGTADEMVSGLQSSDKYTGILIRGEGYS